MAYFHHCKSVSKHRQLSYCSHTTLVIGLAIRTFLLVSGKTLV